MKNASLLTKIQQMVFNPSPQICDSRKTMLQETAWSLRNRGSSRKGPVLFHPVKLRKLRRSSCTKYTWHPVSLRHFALKMLPWNDTKSNVAVLTSAIVWPAGTVKETFLRMGRLEKQERRWVTGAHTPEALALTSWERTARETRRECRLTQDYRKSTHCRTEYLPW